MKIASAENEKSEIDKEGDTELNVDAVVDELELQAYKPVSHLEFEEVDLIDDDDDDGSISENGDVSSLVPKESVSYYELSVRWKIKSLLSHGAIVVIGVVLLIAAGIASQYHPPNSVINGNYSECTDNATDDYYYLYIETTSVIIDVLPTTIF